ncbi:unnamed protein product [Victoria cruziana]
MFTILGFSQIQFEGFCRFIDQGLMEELHQFPKIEDTDQEIEFQLFGESYQLVEPLIKEIDAAYESITYSSELYVPAGLIWRTSRNMQEQTVLLGNIPLMNSLGTSIVNGIYRIVINQILQSPSIYYSPGLDHNRIFVYTGTIISDWGGRSELEIVRKERIWAHVSRKQKISILVLSSAMGSSLREILDNVCYPKIFLSFPKEKEKKKISSKENAILEFYQKFSCVGGDPVFSELNLDIPQNNTFLLPRDVLAAANHLIGMKFGMGTLNNMNHFKNKRIHSVADLLQDQFRLALVRLENVVRGTICGAIWHKLIPTRNLVTSTPLTTTYVSFFGLHPLSQVLDRSNPLTQIVHGQKSSYLGPGGLTGQTASFRIRDIHPSHYGRICPIDTSEGINVGLIGSLAIHARVGDWGSIETPFYEISKRSKEERMVYLSPSRDEYYIVAARNSLALTWCLQEEEVGPARYRQKFLTIAWEHIHLRNIYPFQYFSIGASLIPFIEHNDSNRALMSSNMQHQAVPLSQSEKCIVGTGLERQATFDSGGSAIAKCEGKIIYTDAEKIVLSGNGDTISILLVMYQHSNKNTCMHQKPKVHRGKYLKKGQILADGAATVGGELALGKNVSVAYMPWEGYNSEDAILISERLKYEIQTHVTSQGPERITNEIPHLEPYLLHNLDRNGIVMLGSWVETGDVLEGKLMPLIVFIAKETCLKLPIGRRGRVIDVRWGQKKGGSIYNPEMICVYISKKHKIKVGDKVGGDMGIKVSFQKFCLDRICLIFKMEHLLICLHHQIPFDERYEQEDSRKLVFSELFEASKQTTNPWSYMLKLIHQVDDKIHGHSSGHYALVTQQPLRGRAKQEGFGVAHILQEMLTYKSDDIRAHQEGAPESFRLLVCELRSLSLELNHFLVSEKTSR